MRQFATFLKNNVSIVKNLIGFAALLLLLPHSFAFAKPCVVATSSASMFTSSKRFKFLADGHRVAFRKNGIDESDTFFVSDGSEVDLLKTTQKAINNGCKVLIGFYTSKSCLLAGPILKKNKVVGLSPSCGHDRVQEFYPHLFTGVTKITNYAKAIAKYINEGTRKNNYLVVQPTDQFSVKFAKEIQALLTKKATEISIDRNGNILDNSKNFVNEEDRLIVFTTYPTASVPVLISLGKNSPALSSTDIIASSSWSYDLSMIRKVSTILTKTDNLLVPDSLLRERQKQELIKLDVSFTYNEALTYSSFFITDISLKCYKSISTEEHKSFRVSAYSKCLHSDQSYAQSAKIRFKKGSSFSDTEIKLYDLKGRL